MFEFRHTLAFKLVLLVLVCSLIPLGATAYVSAQEASNALTDASAEQQAVETGQIAENTRTRTGFYDKQVRLMRDHPAVRNVVKIRRARPNLSAESMDYDNGEGYVELLSDTDEYRRSQEYFARVDEQNPSINSIRVFWSDGKLLSGYKLGEEDEGAALMTKEWYREVMDREQTGPDEVHVSPINVAESTGEPAIRYAMPIQLDGNRYGLIVVSYDANRITEPVTNLSIGEEGYGMLVDPDYTNDEGKSFGPMYVANGRNPELAFNTSSAGDLVIPSGELTGQTGSIDYAADGRNWHAEYRQVELANGKQYYAVATVPESQMLAGANAIREWNFMIAGVAGVLVLIAGVVASRRLTAPIKRLAEDARAVAGGDLDHEIRTSAVSSEMETLTNATRTMKENVVESLERAESLTDHLEATADDYNDVMSACADGDLTRRMDPDGESEAMREIAHAFNEMMDDWEGVIRDLKAFAGDVARASTEVDASTGEVRDTSEEVSRSVESISDGAETQAEQLDTVVDEMSELSATVEEIAASAETVAERSEETAELGETGREAAAAAIDEMHAVEDGAGETVERVEQLNERIETIGEITEVISDIAEQTNLLALNANIEAAHADGDGDGFAVVASEVKELAAESRESAAEIEAEIAEVQAHSERTVEEIAAMESRIEEGVATVEDAVEALEAVSEKVDETDAGIREIDDATSSQADSTQEITSMAEDVAAISEETTAEAGEVAAAAEQQTASLVGVSDTVSALSEQAADLEELLEQFDVEDETAVGGTEPAAGEPEPTANTSPDSEFDFESTAVDPGEGSDHAAATDGGTE